MRYRVLGALAAVSDEGLAVPLGGPRQRLVLALLLRDAGRVVRDDAFVDALWPEDPPAGARHTVQTYISGLRRVLGHDIRRVGGGYVLAADADAVDAHRFEALVETARAQVADAPEAAGALLREALGLWHGEPYADLHDALVLQGEVHRLQQARLDAVEDRIDADLAAGHHARLTTELEALARDNPYRERIHSLLMLALYRSGRQAEALRAYDRAREALVTDVGIDPAPQLQRLHRQILEQDPALLPRRHGQDVPDDAAAMAAQVAHAIRGVELRDRLVRRGPASTWRAYQPSTSREVAVTVIAAHEANTPALVRTFDATATQLTALDHPHLLALLDRWRDPSGAYLLWSWPPGGTVHATLADGAWSTSAALGLVEQVGDALTALHRAGLIHGDVSTETVLLDGEGRALLMTTPVVLGAAGVPQGSAPEVRHGQPAGVAADVYGLAALALEALTGTAPQSHAGAVPIDDDGLDLPRGITDVLARATSADPSSRHERVADLVRELRQAAGADVVGMAGADEGAQRLRNPYKGLRAFQESDAGDFHGREDLVEELTQAVADHRIVAVVGPSGSGKSSAVRAGLVPALRRRGLLLTEMFPGAHPFEEMEAALLRVAVDCPEGLLADLLADERGMLRAAKQALPPDGELVVVIDQFEELYSLTADADLRRLFIDGLVALADDERARVRVVITLRADFFDRPLQHHAFGTLVRRGLVPVGMPSPAQLARAISQPARQVGVGYEAGLIDAIVRDVADQPGSLPLLQHALTELFERREGHVLSADAYHATGGVLGALGRRADELHRSLPAGAQAVAQQVFLRLVTVDDRGDVVRRRARRAELTALEADPAAVAAVVDAFGSHRMLSFDHDPVTRSPTVEVAHEAMFSEWGRLRGWVEARREDLLLHRRLTAAVSEWQQSGEHPDYLLSGGRLAQFERWAGATDLALTAGERDLLTSSRAQEDARTSRRRRRRRTFLGALAGVAVLAVSLAALALVQRDRARTGEQIALSRELSAASRLQQAVDPDLSVLLALEAVEVARDVGRRPLLDAVTALHEAVLGHRLLATVEAGGTLVAAAGGADVVFISGPPSQQAATWDLRTGDLLAVLRDDGREAFQAASSADGRRAVETFVGGPTLVWDLDASTLLRELPATTQLQLWPALSDDGTTLAVANLEQFGAPDQSISLWDLETGQERLRFPHAGNARDLAFSPDGTQLAVADFQNAVVRLYDTTSGDVLRTIGDSSDPRGIDSVAFSPSGEQLAMFVFTPRELRLVDLPSGEVASTVPMGTAALGGRLCYSGDGEAVAVATQDGLLEVYDAAGLPRLSLPGSAAVESLACGATGDRLVMATDDGVLRLWGLGADDTGEVLAIAGPPPFTGVWSPDGDGLLTTHYGRALVPDPDLPVNGTLHRYDARSGRLLEEVGDLHPFPPWWVVASPDGTRLATNANPFGDADPAEAGGDVPRNARLAIHDAVTLQRLHDVEGGGWPLGFSPDSRYVLVGGVGGARVVEVATGTVERELAVPAVGDEPVEVGAGGFLADGRHVVLVADAPEGWIVDVGTGAVAARFCRGGGGPRLVLSRDRTLAAVTAGFGRVEVWDVEALLASGGAPCPGDDEGGPVHVLDAAAELAMGFGAGDRLLATAGFDGVLAVWDVETGEAQLRLEHEAQIGGASFSPDGRHLLVTVNDAGGTQHVVHVLTLDPDELVAIARERVTRQMTDAECEEFLPDGCA